jgi:hypothetical protein
VNADQKKAFRDGYQRALKEVLDDLSSIHAKNPTETPVRTVVDHVWHAVKQRLLRSRNEKIFSYEQ